MTEIYHGLKMELKKISPLILPVLKTLSNKIRFNVLISLLDGKKDFHYILNIIDVQKSTLANHLKALIKSNLIKKPSYGTYQITEDGIQYIKKIYSTFKNSKSYQKIEEMRNIERRKMSNEFFGQFFRGNI